MKKVGVEVEGVCKVEVVKDLEEEVVKACDFCKSLLDI